MKYRLRIRVLASTLLPIVAILMDAASVAAQGYGGPLTIEGLHQQNNHNAAVRAFGGVTIGTGQVASMFVNPSSMHGLAGPQISLGAGRQYRDLEQTQEYAPVRYYPNLSLLLEGMTDRLPDPDPDRIGFTQADSVQRPFDDIPPNWSTSRTNDLPLHALVAAPFSLGTVTLTAGAGYVQYANLDHFYQNNNVLDPPVLSARPLPTVRPTDNDPLTVNWYQTVRSREGALRGYGASVAGHIERYNLTLGFSGVILSGSSDDFEQQVNRGQLTFFANSFRADSSGGVITGIGTSEFSGIDLTFGGALRGRYITAGFSVKPPLKIKRSYRMDFTAAGTTGPGGESTFSIEGEDDLQLPWRGSVGLILNPDEALRIGLEYETRPYGSATFTSASQVESSPWRSASLFRIGAEYDLLPWLALRGGIRGEAEAFSPEGSALLDDPVTYRVYSAGLGVWFAGLRWNVTYENAHVTYQDIWGSALSNNSDMRHSIITDVSYTIPFRR